MTETRWSEKYIIAAKLRENVLPTNEEVVKHYYVKWSFLEQTDSKLIAKSPEFSDLKTDLVSDVSLRIKSSLPVLSKSRIETKLFKVIKKLRAAKRRASKNQQNVLTEKWLFELFDISPCKCKESADLALCFWNEKYECKCPFELRIPEKEFEFLKDQRSGRKILSFKVDRAYQKQRDVISYKKRKVSEPQEGLKKPSGRPRKDESAWPKP